MTTSETTPNFTIDLDQAVSIDLPRADQELTPTRFSTRDGRTGWSLRIPGQRPIATPAYEDGMLFIGGGYGSYEFYASDAATGELAWQMKTADDGPTAAVVEGGLVAFNTESCTIIVCEARTGRILWQEWLGDPLMSQPAIAGERLFMVYPAEQRKPLLRPEMTVDEQRAAIKEAKEQGVGGSHQHRLLCTSLRTGEHLWEQEISGDAITAPVVDGEQVFLTCLDGTSFCLNIADGSVVWKRDNQGTSAPLIVEGRVIITEKEKVGREVFERMRRAHRGTGAYHGDILYRRHSRYFDADKGGGSGLRGEHAKDLDAGVGFASSPSSAKLGAATGHLGVSSVSGAWAYQGSRSAYARGRIFNSQGTNVYCLLEEDERKAWEAEVRGSQVDIDDQIFLPPALGRECLYLTSTLGHALSVRQESGEVELLYDVGRPIAFQPCLAKGRVHFGTAVGDLACLETGSDDADGWHMWGGNAQHNKIQ